MKLEILVPATLEVTHLVVNAGVRYWEDATVNGIQDTDGTLIPHREGDLWKPKINLENRQIEEWPSGTTAQIHYKVCDAGQYWLANEAGELVARWKGDYVPDHLLCVGDEGYGDYIIFNVGENGLIIDWVTPTLDNTEWE